MIRYKALDVLCVVFQSTSNPSRYTIGKHSSGPIRDNIPQWLKANDSSYRDAVRLINVTV